MQTLRGLVACTVADFTYGPVDKMLPMLLLVDRLIACMCVGGVQCER